MSRTGLHRPRRYRAVCHRPATGTRLLPTSHSRLDHSLGWGIPLALSGVEACPEPRRRGSQERNRRGLLPSPFPPITPHLDSHYKRCPKALRLRLRSDQSPSRPLYGRSPDKTRHSLSKGHCQVRAPLTRRIRFASSGDAPEHGVMSLPRASAPFSDSPGVDLAGQSEQSDNLRLKTNAPFTDSTVVTTGEHPTTNGGHGSPLPSLGVVEHFWWSGLPHAENFSGLLHIPSEVRGCRRAVADLTCIGTGVDAFLRNRPGPSIPSLPLAHFPTRDDRPVAQGVGAPSGASTPFPLPFTIPRLREESRTCPLTLPPSPHSRKEPPISPSPPPPPRKKPNFPENNQRPRLRPLINQNSLSQHPTKEQPAPVTPPFFDRHKQ